MIMSCDLQEFADVHAGHLQEYCNFIVIMLHDMAEYCMFNQQD